MGNPNGDTVGTVCTQFGRYSMSVLLLAVFISTVAHATAINDLVVQIRNTFNISYVEATDKELENFLNEENNFTFVTFALNQIDIGYRVENFVNTGNTYDLSQKMAEFWENFAMKRVIDLLEKIGYETGIFWL